MLKEFSCLPYNKGNDALLKFHREKKLPDLNRFSLIVCDWDRMEFCKKGKDMDYRNELTGMTALVTGGTKGAGRAISQRLSDAGATVIITARQAQQYLPANAYFIAADLSQPDGVSIVTDKIKKEFGGVDILVNNLGGAETPGGGFAVLTDDHWLESLRMNLLVPVRLDRELLPYMLSKQKGVIIHIASIQARLPCFILPFLTLRPKPDCSITARAFPMK